MPPKSSLGPVDVDVPEILDLVRESCSAQAIRLCNTYGRLLRESTPARRAHDALSTALLQTAQTAVAQFSEKSKDLGIDAAGLFCSALKVQDEGHLIVVGPNAVAIAQRIYAKLPTRLVAPALADVRPSLQDRGPGIYLIQGSRTSGPLTETRAVSSLSPLLKP